MSDRHFTPLTLVLLLMLASACERRSTNAAQARAAANAYLRTAYSADPKYYDIQVKDGGAEWKVTYFARGEAAGGTETVFVDKKTGKVLREEGTQ